MNKMKFKYAPYSYSKIKTFEDCPRKFKYQYIDKIPIERKPQKHFDRGKMFHLLLEHEGDLKSVQKTKDWEEIKEHKLLDSNDIKNIYSIYKQFVSTKPGKDIVTKKMLLKEFPLGLNVDLEVVKYDSPDVVLRGYIDACYITDRDDVCVLVDWKSGKYVPKDQQSYAQLLWYSLGMFSLNPLLEKIVLVFAYVEHKKINTKVVYRKDIHKYKKALFDKIQKIEEEKEFPKNEGTLCDWCDYREICIKD
jgi:CRISPR/Cas system-associated exonuclease Cas4 (RecB family)